jgi:uncharacterized protein (DUF1015 family)
LPVAEVRPFNALHYDLSTVGSLADVTAPPYDVIDSAERAELVERSPFNVVELDLPEPTEPGGNRYQRAAETLEEWILAGVLTQDRAPTVWALTQDYTGPDGVSHRRHGLLARVRVTDYGAGLIRPHERTQPGPRQDRLDLTKATRYNLSPIFSLTTEDAWPAVEGSLEVEPWAEVADAEGTVHRLWPIDDPSVHGSVTEALAEAELLIADGHHRYETARVYRDEVGGEGDHQYTLMALTGLADPGLTIYPTHRLLTDLQDRPVDVGDLPEQLGRWFEIEETDRNGLEPGATKDPGCFGYVDASGRQLRLRLLDRAGLDELMPGKSEAYRTLDAAILEKAVFENILGMSEEDVEAKDGIDYAKTLDSAVEAVAKGNAEAAFILRATPVEQVRAVAAAGETMPPKSTYFFPKLLSGMAFNPLS